MAGFPGPEIGPPEDLIGPFTGSRPSPVRARASVPAPPPPVDTPFPPAPFIHAGFAPTPGDESCGPHPPVGLLSILRGAFLPQRIRKTDPERSRNPCPPFFFPTLFSNSQVPHPCLPSQAFGPTEFPPPHLPCLPPPTKTPGFFFGPPAPPRKRTHGGGPPVPPRSPPPPNTPPPNPPYRAPPPLVTPPPLTRCSAQTPMFTISSALRTT